MKSVEYVFHIDVFTPDTLPMARLAQYISELAKLIGHHDHTHFLRVDEGSARLVHRVDIVDAPKVEARLNSVRSGDAPKEALRAFTNLDSLLADDNAVGKLLEAASGRVVVPFVGRNRPKPISIPAFRDSAVLDGKVVSIGGRDATAHATLQDGEIYHTNISMRRDLAMDLAPLLYGPHVRLHGNGKFERGSDSIWRISDFRVERFETLKSDGVRAILDRVQQAIRPELRDNLRSELEQDRFEQGDDK